MQDELNLTKCWCGQSGCIETFLSGPGLENDFERIVGSMLGADEINTLAENGDSLAERTMRRYEDRMARSLAHGRTRKSMSTIKVGYDSFLTR